MPKHPWRFQCDVPYGETDPVVTVFMGEVFTRDDGSVFVEQSISVPVLMPLSQVDDVLSLIDASVMTEKQDEQLAQQKEHLETLADTASVRAKTKARNRAKRK